MKCIYLIQSNRPAIPYSIPSGSDVLLLQWQKDYVSAPNSFHLPNSTWASGRNELLKRAMTKGMYDYYVFLDDDLKFYFSLETFESLLKATQLDRAAPNMRGKQGWCSNSSDKFQLVKYVDHSFIAVSHQSAVELFPYTLDYDRHCWWLASENMCERFWDGQKKTIRFNQLVFINQESRPYPRGNYPGVPKNIELPYH
ncbi:MAG: hypothetical protein MI975_21745 [Cytophagales bacterium]|nr:hypothetical protein [Cytophagales bacterium]